MAVPYFGPAAGTPFGDILRKVGAIAPPPADTIPFAPAAAAPAPAAAAPAPAAVSGGGGGGGITVRPWWDIFPKTPAEAITRTIETPVVSGAGAPAAVVFKSITKQAGMKFLPIGIAAAGGFLFSRLFGGGSQELAQDITQEPEVTVTPEMPVDVGVSPTIQALLDIITKQQLAAGAGEISVGAGAAITGDVGTSTIRNITNTYTKSVNIQKTITETYPTQITVTKTVTTAAQEATQEQGTDWVTLAIIGIIGLVGYSMFKKRG